MKTLAVAFAFFSTAAPAALFVVSAPAGQAAVTVAPATGGAALVIGGRF